MIYRYMQNSPEIDKSVFIAPTATVIGRVKLSRGASIWFNTIVRGDINSIEVGEDSNIQDNCVMHVTHEHGVKIAQRVTVGHGVILHGCTVMSDCLIGMGAVLLDGVVIEEGCMIAAGAVLSPNTIVPANSLVMGVPGKVVRKIGEAEQSRMQTNWKSYVEYAREYQDSSVFEEVLS
ncbi:MAG: gamma carbonic anhydrase family protein [Candidatus Melainabacteria bacterium]|nr:gamma carbonic anhydrase family protein [Candidatus Melainabacteria bacterium]